MVFNPFEHAFHLNEQDTERSNYTAVGPAGKSFTKEECNGFVKYVIAVIACSHCKQEI